MRAPLLASLALLAGCAAPLTERLTVTAAGPGLTLAPRPADCRVDFYRTRPPDRAYDEVATLHFEGGNPGWSAADAQEALSRRACQLGADAVVVTRDFVRTSAFGESAMTGTAVSYADEREKHRAGEALRRAEATRRAQEAAARQRAAELAKPRPRSKLDPAALAAAAAAAPKGFVRRIAKAAVLARALPDRRSEERGGISAGADVWIDPKPTAGWHRAWTPRLRSGWVEGDVLEVPAEADLAPTSGEGTGSGPASADGGERPAAEPPR